jgi:Raf kinase inhibitor-like YbhB/YbcL family protein
MDLKSAAFSSNQKIPIKYTGDGQNISPPLSWNRVPPGTKSLALIADDPDAPSGVFTHWIIFNIPADNREINEAVSTSRQLTDTTRQGINDFGSIGYRGPHPPPGKRHRYYFSLYALDQSLELKTGTSKRQLLEAMHGHILALSKLIGIYWR